MKINRPGAALLLFAASIPSLASVPLEPTPSCEVQAEQALYALAIPEPPAPVGDYIVSPAVELPAVGIDTSMQPAPAETPPRDVLAAFAMTLRDIRYRRGGRD